MTDEAFVHRPVMLEEITKVFAEVPAGIICDATLGGGGHSERLLDSRPDCMVVGIDRDSSALSAASARLARFGTRFVAIHERFDHLDSAMTDLLASPTFTDVHDGGPLAVTGVLFDLGVSSPQLDRSERGFSYRSNAPLDMRMDASEPWSAADVVNGYPVEQLARVLRDYGDERFAFRIAVAIDKARPVETTGQLADIVKDAIPAAARRRGGHPAKRSFQAIRIEVNKELEILPDAIDRAIEMTAPGGRVAVLSYHSGEDRIVKQRFQHAADGDCPCPAGLPCVCDAIRTVRLVRGVPKKPSSAEIAENPRAESARLRVAERRRRDDTGRD